MACGDINDQEGCMKKTKLEWEAEIAAFHRKQTEAVKKGAVPIGAAIIPPNARGVVGVRRRQDDPEPDPT